ncbi:MAG: DEAD/DEAH box helicase [Elusimicrobia bacterium]|nr:DEAD/DEAH box helicase [Elusimicrobiota bacterium]
MKTKSAVFVSGVPNLSAFAYFALSRLARHADALMCLTEEDNFPEISAALLSLHVFYSGLKTDFEIIKWRSFREDRSVALDRIYSKAVKDRKIILLTSPAALESGAISKAEYLELSFTLKTGLNYSRDELISRFHKAGYSRTGFVEDKGEFAVRGSVIDFFSYDLEKPVRLFFSDILESIRHFEIETQHTFDFQQEIKVIPNAVSGNTPLSDILCMENGEVVIEAGADYKKTEKIFGDKFAKIFIISRMPVAVYPVRNPPCPKGTAAAASGRLISNGVNFGCLKNLSFNLEMESVRGEIKRLAAEGFRTGVFCINRGEIERITELFLDYDMDKYCSILTGDILEGFIHPPSKTAVITTCEIFQRRWGQSGRASKPKSRFFKWTDLKAGDYLVHEDYGIGRYQGIKQVPYASVSGEAAFAECIGIEYSRGDKLMVPLHEFNRVQKYISSEGKEPKLSHMDTKTWQEVKNRVKKELETLAREILSAEARRLAVSVKPMPEEEHFEKEFADSFPFEETADQKRAIREVLSDISSDKPMNRLVVGDVGFGKTEVAMRAAMRCVVNGRQAAALAPTTILADQHYRTFSARFREFPVNIAVISRFETPGTQKKTLEKLKSGVVDIIIGTHRLLQDDVRFRDLGLLVIDEEHRFGVKDKEKLKNISSGAHVLTLSATPIPRTLYQSLSNLKSMSVIETPPLGRLPISTFVRPFDEKTVIDAVGFELSRGGQIYYVHNRVRTIDSAKAFLKKLMPNLRIAVVHGRVKSDLLEKHMWDFLNGKYDMLLASTIIESGLDIPRVNTLIVENAHELGLAQLYQLRGRIGREKQKAYCYLFFKSHVSSLKSQVASYKTKKNKTCDLEPVTCDRQPETAMSEEAVKRLAALEEFTELGSGFRLAMRDLEIRGAGELLGVKQHGFISAIGLEMYIKLLNHEIDRIKGKTEIEKPETKIDLDIPAFIPPDYMPDEMERLNYYKRLLNSDFEKIDIVMAELEDLCGPAPAPLMNLAEIIKLKKKLPEVFVRSVTQKGDFFCLLNSATVCGCLTRKIRSKRSQRS